MGSFANSLHVKSDSESAVAASIAEIVRGEGWQPTDKLPGRRVSFALSPSLRGLHVSAAAGGWVSVLDSDGFYSLTQPLAERLRTHALFVMVNDSDSWSYLLAAPDGSVSEFDSDETDDDFEDEELAGADLAAASSALQRVQSLMQDGSLYQRMQQVQDQMAADAPPEIKAALERIHSRQGTADDMQRYQAWAMQEMPKYVDSFKSLFGAELGLAAPSTSRPARKRSATKAEQTAQRQRLDDLRPIFAAGTTDEQVQAAFERRAIFAEEVLAEFLPLVGINAFYANLSYSYLGDTRPQELAAQGIRLSQHLRFESQSDS
jgi:hypothetical protein